MEEKLVRRVLKASVVVAALVGFCGAVYLGTLWAFAFILAAAWSIVNLWVLERLLVLLFRGGSRLALAAVFCLKITVLYGLILLYLIAVPWRPSALLGGITLPYAVIVLKALGRSLIEAMGRKEALQATGDRGKQDGT